MHRSIVVLALTGACPLFAPAQISLPPGHSWSVFAEPLGLPDGLLLHPNGFLYVADESFQPLGGIWKIAADGTVSRLVTGMNRVDGMTLDWRTGELIVSEEALNGDVWRVNPDDGSRTVEVPGTLSITTEGVAYDYETMVLYLAEDLSPGRIQAWDGTTLSLIASGLSRPEGLAVDITGDVIVAVTATNRLLRIDPASGASSDVIPPGTAIQPDNVIYQSFTGDFFVGEDRSPGRIFRVSPDGSFTVFASGLSSPQGMFFAPDGRMFVSEQGRGRVIVIEGYRPSLSAPARVPLGGTATLDVDGGALDAGKRYRLFLSTLGSYPGTRLDARFPGDRRRVPFNVDPLLIDRAFPGSAGTLGPTGRAGAFLPIPSRPEFAGRSFLTVGFVLGSNRVDSISSVVKTEVVQE